MYGSASTDQETREDAGRRTSGGGGERKTEKLIITNLHYEVSERELEVSAERGMSEARLMLVHAVVVPTDWTPCVGPFYQGM